MKNYAKLHDNCVHKSRTPITSTNQVKCCKNNEKIRRSERNKNFPSLLLVVETKHTFMIFLYLIGIIYIADTDCN